LKVVREVVENAISDKSIMDEGISPPVSSLPVEARECIKIRQNLVSTPAMACLAHRLFEIVFLSFR
jgi:hypothetical protein